MLCICFLLHLGANGPIPFGYQETRVILTIKGGWEKLSPVGTNDFYMPEPPGRGETLGTILVVCA